jgi:hypothetical protein
MSPLPNTKVIPTGWAEHHRPVVEGTLKAEGTVYRVSAGPPPYPRPVAYAGNRAPIHTAMFDVQPLQREGGGNPGEQPTSERQYVLTTKVVGAPAFRAGERGDVVEVLGREFRIINLVFGANLWEIDLICVDNMTQQNPD